MNQVRIIGGLWRGRKIHFRPSLNLRPTLDAVRETLFNWLMFDIQDAKCLDAFAGSGALGFEALSRGASFVTFIERERDVCAELRGHLKDLDASSRSRVVHDSALHVLRKNPEAQQFQFIFLDPPFEKGLLKLALKAIRMQGFLQAGGMVYFEAEKGLDLEDAIGEDWVVHRQKTLGEVRFGLLV